MNHKQSELAEQLFRKTQAQYPEISINSITQHPANPLHIWVNIAAPDDEEREIELRHFAAEIEADIVLDYGYRISLMPEHLTNNQK
jgi:hypothetical protein